MKLVFTIFTIVFSLTLIAQKSEINSRHNFQLENAKLLSSSVIVKNSEEIINFISTTILKNEDYGITTLSEIKSLTGNHYTFNQTFENVMVYQALIKVNTDFNGEITSIFSLKQELSSLKNIPWPSISQAKQSVPESNQIVESSLIWAKVNGTYTKCVLTKFNTPEGFYKEQITDYSNEIVFSNELTNHLAPVDTTVKALVYLPDPLTKVNTIYGGKYIDNNDAASPELDAQRDTVDIDITFDNGTFYLENSFVKIVATSIPLTPPVTSTTPFFYYDRSESGFEEANVIYHITKIQNYIQLLGFTNIVNYQIEADCHGFNGADNSAFNSGTNPPSIIFGEGGVDDAEDADVIVHEYTHAIMHSAAPNTNFGTERNAMDEAFGDFMAISYSSTFDIYHADFVFSWDGHNEYWNGRLGTSTAMYPDDLQFNLYKDAPMWSSALLRIERNIGRDLATKIALESAFSYSSAMTMAQGAAIFITTDNLMNNGANYAEICWTFKDKGMINSCTVARPADMLSAPSLANIDLQVLNSENFAKGLESLTISANSTFELFIYDTSGKLVSTYSSFNNSISISPENFENGTYIYKVISSTETGAFKILKY